MNKIKFLLAPILVFVLLNGNVFAQKTPQEFLSIGSNYAIPILDDYLLEHSMYGEDYFAFGNDCGTAKGGIVGTAGLLCVRNASLGNLKVNTEARFRDITSGPNFATPLCVAPGSEVFYNMGQAPTPCSGINGGKVTQLSENVYPTGKKPKFPTDLPTSCPPGFINGPLSNGWLTASPGSTTTTLKAGNYYFDGLWEIYNSVTIVPNESGSYKTVIYVKEMFVRSGGSGIKLMPQEPAKAQGQILIIVYGDKKSLTTDCNAAHPNFELNDVSLEPYHVSYASEVMGTIIVPNGGAYFQNSAKLTGQVIAKRLFFVNGYNGGAVFEYVRPAVVSVVAKDHTFPEDKFWDFKNTGWGKPNACDEPKYTDNAKWSENKNRDYDTSITISMLQPLKSGTVALDYTITADNGIVGTPMADSNKRAARVYLEKTSGNIIFNSSTSEQKIPVKVIDFGDNKGDVTFTVSFEISKETSSDVSPIAPAPITITILTDDPNGVEIPSPMFTPQDKIFEKYNSLGTQNIGEFSSSYDCDLEYELVSATIGALDVSDWVEIVGNKFQTTAKYNADYDIGQEQIAFSVVTARKIGESTVKSMEFVSKFEINPWNTKAFNVNTYVADCDENSFTLLPVFENSVSDADKPSDLNNQRIGGLTLDSIYDGKTPQKNFDYGSAEKTLKTSLGATVTIKDDKTLRYDLTGVELANEFMDEFWYTAIDTAEYDYSTDIWVKSVKVIVYVNLNVPFPKNAYYYDSDGDGVVDSVVIEFNKEIEDLMVFRNFAIDFSGATFNSFDLLNDNTIYLLLNNAMHDLTSDDKGNMSIKISYETTDKNGNVIKPEISIVAQDRAAPVIVDDAIIVKSLSGGNDTLIIKFSEKMKDFEAVGKIPFKFFKDKKGGTEYSNVDFISIATVDFKTFTLVVSPTNSGMNKGVNGGDWVFINSSAGIKDDLDNAQEVYNNKPVEIKQRLRAKLISAAYFDTDVVSDGYIDMIRFNFGTTISKTFAQEIIDSLVFPNNTSRQFDKTGEITLIDNGFELSVVENKSKSARTSVNEFDSISIKAITGGALTIEKSSVLSDDSIAPVILHAIYRVDTDTTLDVVFSEPVDFISGNPYLFWDVAPDPKQFEMTFKNGNMPVQIDEITLQYSVASSTNPYPVDNDSIWLMQTGIISDKKFGNVQDLTVRAPLILANKYKEELILHIAPQPMQVINVGGKRTHPKELNPGLVDFYSISGNRNGVAIIIEATGPVSNPKDVRNKGVVKIFDQTGNAVSDELQMMFSSTKGGGIAGSVVWDGKNSVGRNVGAGSYLAIVQCEVAFDDRDNTEVRVYQKIIAVVVGDR